MELTTGKSEASGWGSYLTAKYTITATMVTRTASNGGRRLWTEAPATLIRFSASGSADGGNVTGSGATGAAVTGSGATGWPGPGSAGVPTVGAGAGAAACTSAASFPSRQSANWPSSFVDTSLIMPLPNCAILPEIFKSVSTLTAVLAPSARNCAVIAAVALPAPRTSRPLASMTAR